MNNELIGWIGSILFSLCALPQTLLVCKQKHADGLSWLFLNMWFFGEIFSTIYICNQNILQIPLLANYSFNILLLLIIFYWKIVGRKIKIS